MVREIAVIGPKQSGKSAVINRLSGKNYTDKPVRIQKIGEFSVSEYASGQEKSAATFLLKAEKILLVLDVSHPSFMTDAQQYLAFFADQGSVDKIQIICQKVDLCAKSKAIFQEISALAQEKCGIQSIQIHQVSALTGAGFDNLCQSLQLDVMPIIPVDQVLLEQAQQPVEAAVGRTHRLFQPSSKSTFLYPVADDSIENTVPAATSVTVTKDSKGHRRTASRVQQKDVSQPAPIASLINVQEQQEIQALWHALNDYLAPKRSFLRRTFHLHNRHWLNEVERFIQDNQAAMNGKTLRLQEMKDQLREIFAQPLHKKPVNQGGHIDRIIQRWDIQLVNQDATQPAVGSQPF